MAKPNEVPKGGWDPFSIKAELHRQHMTMARLAEANGKNPKSMSHVWKRPLAWAEEAIADFLETPKEKLFPDRYPKTTARILDSKFLTYTARQKRRAPLDQEAA
ncbi:helix-turn-helix domain-containing protein [Labrenzia sp. PHM005]|uniref:helix-turn-helix domain-containing protein n=1 Tax=Labrenzia sp. PHM005 TaxID=2590016 RepID=UPI00114057A3|nr:helix-turn-helix domain-containing protein [Labrenzia sp. PHM005]QDG74426.1 transcriptional regulator [Labrenzia sp. PHM005]